MIQPTCNYALESPTAVFSTEWEFHLSVFVDSWELSQGNPLPVLQFKCISKPTTFLILSEGVEIKNKLGIPFALTVFCRCNVCLRFCAPFSCHKIICYFLCLFSLLFLKIILFSVLIPGEEMMSKFVNYSLGNLWVAITISQRSPGLSVSAEFPFKL